MAAKPLAQRAPSWLNTLSTTTRNVSITHRRSNTVKETKYQDSRDRELRLKQRHQHPALNPTVYIERGEVATHDGYKLVEPMIDPAQQPHELHLIKKTGELKNEPYWAKDALAALGFQIARHKQWDVVYTIQPNTTRVNELLWLCKHLVKVTPIKFKNGYPSEKDASNTRINLQTGEVDIVRPLEHYEHESRLDCYRVNNVPVSDELERNETFPLTRVDLHRDFHRTKQLQRLNDEYFPAKYEYTYDQDKPGVIRLRGKASTSLDEDDVDRQ